MMRLDSGGTETASAAAASSSAVAAAAAQPSMMAMSSASLSVSASSDFMGNQLASYFSQLFEKNPPDQSVQSKESSRKSKKNKKAKTKEKRKLEPLTDLYPSLPHVSIPRNPSPFAVFAAIRNTCLENKRRQATLLQLQSAAAWKEVEEASASGEATDSSSDEAAKKQTNLPKIVGIGLQGVFEIIRESQPQYPTICRRALVSLLNILEGLQPEELSNEPSNIIEPMFETLLELSALDNSLDEIRSLASACLLSLSVAYGDTGKLLLASSAMLMSQPQGQDLIKMPYILVSLQRSVISVMLGKLDHPDFMSQGLTSSSLIDTFEVKFKTGKRPQVVYSLASDGVYLYLQSNQGLTKVGSGYGSTIKGHVYRHNEEFYSQPGWIGFVSGSLYFKASNSSLELNQVQAEDLTVCKTVVPARESTFNRPYVMFSDGVHIGVVAIDVNDKFVIKFLDAANNLSCATELPLKLARKCVDVFGASIFEEGKTKHQVDFGCDDESLSLQTGKEFALMLSSQGRVYFTGKSASLGHKQPCPAGQWNEMAITKSPKIVQFSVGHEGQHALLLSEDGSVYFVGTARRGEDGDQTKATRRQPKPVKPKKLARLDGYIVSHVSANSGTSALVTKEGDLFLFGKDSSHCDFTTGQVMELKGQPIIQVVLGKAHVVVLTRDGDVFTFGMNNKGQCGRDFPTSREGSAGGSGLPSLNPMPSVSNSGGGLDGLDDVNSDHDVDTEHENTLSEVICPAGKHKWKHDQCMVCAVCGECTGYGSNCVSSGRPDRNPGMLCGCGSGDSGCSECGCCHTCAGEDSDVAGAAAALASEKARLRDRLIRMEYLAAETKERYLGPGESEKFIRRRMQKMGNCRRSRRYTEKREGRRESELLKALESSMNKDRNFASAAAAAVSAASNLPAAAAAAAAAAASSSDLEKESGGKLASLPPARLTLPPGVKITQLSAGLHHTLLMSLDGDVYAFGSNTHGQLGLCDLIPRGCPSLIVLPSKAVAIAAGSYHSVVLTEEGQIFTFGSYQKGQLGREPPQQASEAAAASAEEIAARELWFALPGIIPNVGSNWGRSATWIGASSEQTFLKVDESLINAKSLMGSTIMANNHQILLLPTQHTADNKLSSNFKSLAISRQDGFCRSFSGPEQATFNGLTVNLDPMYNVLWSYNNETGTLNSYQPTLASQGQGLKETIVSPELALPMASEAVVSRNQAALNMLSCLDTLTHYPEVNLTTNEEETTKSLACKSFSKEDFTAVNRFDNHGGGWGYSGHSIEAIRFMVDTDILLGGFGLFGGRGEYVGKIKLFDIGTEGGDQEGDGELLSESDETAYECGARQKYPILFDEPVTIHAGRWYVAWARVSGPSSDCGSSGQAQVTTEDQIQFFFKSSKKSNNGTDVNAGQVPQLLYKMITSEGQASHRRYDPPEPICVLSHKFAKRVTPDCFQALLSLIQWSWNALKAGLCELMESDETTSQPIILDLQRLIYVCRACLRLTITYTEEVYPGRIVPNQTKPVTETQRLAECIYDVRTLLQQILTDGLSVLQSSKATSSYQHHKTGINMTKVVLNDAHRTFVACFHAFYPTGYLKWACLCNLLASMEDSPDYAHVASNSVVNYDRLLTAVLDALCNPMIKLRNTFPITYSPETETRCKNLSPTENLSITTSMIQAGDSSSQRFPILNELMNFRSHMDGIRFGSWTFREVLDRLLAIASIPVKQALKGDTTTIYSKELVEKSCQVVSSVISELANQTINCETDLHSLGGRILHMTPNRFTRTSNNRTWNTGNGSPDAICFSVDRSGIFIVGCCVYGGMGTYEYELELLDDQSFGGGSNNDKADHGSQQRWTSQEIAHGSYTSDDCVGDIAELKFDRAVPIKPNVKYALRLRNHGGRTSNGDGGISAVKGPDSTAFNFTSCSLSFNGTNPTRGQLPQILYFSSPQENDVQAATKSLAEMYARRTALSMTSAIVKAVTGLLIQARDCVEDEKGLDILNAAPIITKLMPHILASISSLAASDPPSAVQVLSFIQEVLPSVASLQNLYLLHQDNNSSDGCSGDNSEAAAVEVDLEAASQHSTWVESEHPYKPASVNSYRVAFPSTVRWMSVEFDPQCCTTQPEDVLQIYIRNPTSQKIVVNNSSNSNNSNNSNNNNNNVGGPSPTMPLVSHNDVVTMQKYTPVLKKFSGSLNWPRQNVILPGNEVLFSLETASDYVKDDKANNYGFKCLVVGYEGPSKKDEGLKSLEMELAYLGGTCAASLMKKNIPLTNQNGEDIEEDMDIVEDSAAEAFEMHSSLLSKGFALERPPNVQQALDGVIPFSCNSNERLFLRNFVHCAPGTSGGRLARWLQPESFVDVDQCEVLFNQDDMKCNWPTIITIITHDQYGDVVQVPNLRVEVKAIPIEEMNQSVSRLRKMTEPDAMTFGGHRPPSLEPKYEVTVKDKMLYHAITVQKVYENYSFEELRYASPALQRQSENMLVRPNNDGTYSANWTPGNTGFYQLHIVVDGCDMPEPYKVEVKEPPQGVAPPHTGSSKKTPGDHGINRLRKFIAKPSAGLRIRIHPTLQSEQIGVVPVEGTISIMDELQNADGIWVRLCQDSLIEYSTPAYTEGWCLQYNQHLEKTLLIPVAEPKPAPRTSASVASAAERPMMPAPFAAANNPIIEPMLRSSSDIGKPDRNAKKPKGPGNYTVVKCGASGHNVRSNPNLSAAPIGMLALGDAVTVIRTKEVNGEVWVQLDQETGEKHCFSADEGDSWSLAYSNTDILYLENASDVEEHLLSPRGRSMSRPVAVIPPPSQMVNLKKIHEQQPHNEDQHQPLLPPQRPIPPPRHSIGGIQQLQQPPASPRRESLMDGGAASNRARTPSPGDARKPSFFQKWFKGEAIRRGGSQSPPVPRKSTVTSGVAAAAAAMVNKDIPPELMGVSVKELVKVIGESRANGNGVTPPGTPGTPRRASRSASPQLSSRGSSPSSVRLTSGSVMTTAQRAPSKSPLSHEGAVNLVRQDSSQSDNSTSNLVSSLTRDLSQSPHDGSASPSLSMRSEPLRSAESPMRTSSSVIDSPAAKSLTSMQTSSTSGGGLETTAQSTSSITTSTTTAIPVVVPESATSNPSPSLRRKNAKGRSASPSASASTSRPSSSSKQNVTRVRIEAASRAGPMIVKEAMSPSVAESIRSVFAAFVWHEGIVHDAMAVASYLKFHPNMSKHGASSTEAAEEVITEHTRARQRHSVEVSSASAYLNANNIETIDTSSLNANTNRNVAAATSSAKGGAEAIPEDATLQLADSGLPPTIRLLVLIWEEIRSYCIHAILQQVIVASPLHLSSSAASATTSKKSDHHQNSTISNKKDKDHRCSSKPRKSKRSRDEHQLYVDAKEAESVASAASTAASVAGKVLEEAFCQLCEMCGHYFQHPVTYHMRVAHPGCGGHAGSKGYNSGGHYCGGWAGNCGDGGVGGSSWYLICEKCREEHMKRAAPVAAAAAGAQQPLPPPPLLRSASTASEVMDATAKNKANQLLMHQKQQRKKSLTSQLPLARMASPSTAASSSSQINSHIIMNNNAMFLLDLASASNSNLVPPPATSSFSSRKVMMTSSIGGLSAVSELESLDPNPFPLVPFQCFNTLGVRDSHLRLINDELVLDEVLKTSGDIPKEPAAPEAAAEDNEITPPEQFQNSFYEQMGKKPTFSRSASVGNHVLQNQQQLYSGHNVEDGGASSSSFSRKRNSSCEPQNTAGDFLSNPSAALQKLFSVERGSMMVADILQRPVMSFVLQWNDLESLQIAMTNALRKASCRTFAMQALNWLLRSVSQPACLHDLLWCFVSALEGNTAEATATNLNEGDKSAKDKKNHLRSKQMLPNAAGKEGLFDHPTEDISIAGEAIQPLPATFHGLLQTVSDLMLLLPVGSSLQQIAITCWCIKFRPQDHNFLHQSHVFSTISKILSRSEELDTTGAGGAPGLFELESTVESLTDISVSLDLKTSSRMAMVGSLNDNSTETFWESGDEDRNKSKWITAAVKNDAARLKSFSLHIDNGRDLGNKVSHLTFKTGRNADDLHVVKQCDVESRFAGWVTCFIDNEAHNFIKVEAKGPDNSLRLRQVKALGYVETHVEQKQPRASSIQQRNCEAETLRVFRLITSQVFGRLLEPLAPSNTEAAAASIEEQKAEEQEPYLKEHVVGILFSRSKLTHLQKQVCSHIVGAIKKEAARLRDEWEVNLCSGGLPATPEASSDTYCFEMLSLVLALSGSSVGRSHLASQFGLIKDLLTLLHTASGRIQRQVIALLRRILPEVPPQTFAGLLGIAHLPPKDFGILTRSSSEAAVTPKDIGIVDVFLSCISKALTLQVKSKVSKEGGAGGGGGKTHLTTVNLASSIHPRDPTGPRWWLRGTMTKKIAEEIINLLKDMTAGQISVEWAAITKSAVAEAILNLTRLDEGHRDPTECLKYPVLWLALASLCVLDKDHVDGLSSGEWNGAAGGGEAAASRPTCDNHDDGETLAIILCDQCDNLCGDCDRFLHLHRKTKAHQRQVFKEEEDAIKVDLHEGCGRTKLFWLMALADSSTLKAMVEFRDGGRNGGSKIQHSGAAVSSNFSTCRFCLRQSSPDHPVMDSLCSDKECIEYSKMACQKVLTCGHFCGGIAEEATCLPCLHGCSGGNGLRQDADDMCMICFTEALSPIPSIQLECGHVFHLHCCQKILEKRWTGPRITFGFRNCPICKTLVGHVALKPQLDPIESLYEDVKKKALMRLEYEGLSKSEAVMAKGARFHNDPSGFALERYAYYVCFKCGKAYYGGEAVCDADAGHNDDYNPEELVCGGCSDVSRAQMCPKHGTDYLEYKCRYCCSVAVFFCFGTTHFCNACHDDFQRVANVPKQELSQCPVGPKSLQLEGEECPLHVSHPPTGEEYALGCGVCRNAHTF